MPTPRLTRWNLTIRQADMLMEHAEGPRPIHVHHASHSAVATLMARGMLRSKDSGRASVLTEHGHEALRAVMASRADALSGAEIQ